MHRSITALACIALLAAAPRIAAPAAGDLDPAFADDGTVVTPLDGLPIADAVAVAYQPDGKLVVLGRGQGFAPFRTDFILARYHRDGSRDATFGTGGIVITTAPGNQGEAGALLVQPDGKLVVGGSAGTGTAHGFALLRYLPDGTLDPTFSTAGIVVISFGPSSTDMGRALVRQPDGKLVLAGWSDRLTPTRRDFALARYDEHGRLDPTFGDRGHVLTPIGEEFPFDEIAALALQPDGKLVAAGNTGGIGPNGDFALARYGTDGTLDPSFGAGGLVVTDFATRGDRAAAVVLDPAGRVVAGGVGTVDGRTDFALARYLSDGTLDGSFGTGGRVLADIGLLSDDAIAALALEPGGNLVAAGMSSLSGAVARFAPDGSFDGTFGTGGKVVTSILPNLTSYQALVREPGGRLVAAGVTSDGDDFFPSAIAVARYLGGDPCGDGFLGTCCPPSPRPGCRRQTVAGRGRLRLTATTGRRRGRLAWRWVKGEPTTLADAGNAGSDDDHVLCVYDESSGPPVRLLELKAPAGGACRNDPCWRTVDASTLVYRDRQRTPDGVEQVRLHAGTAGRAAVMVRARAGRLAPLTFPLPLPLRVQLQATNASCWESTFSAAGIERRDGAVLSVVGD